MLDLNNYYYVDVFPFDHLNYLLYESKELGEYDTIIIVEETQSIFTEARTFDELKDILEDGSYTEEVIKTDTFRVYACEGVTFDPYNYFYNVGIHLYNKLITDNDTNCDLREIAYYCEVYEIPVNKAVKLVKLLAENWSKFYFEYDHECYYCPSLLRDENNAITLHVEGNTYKFNTKGDIEQWKK